MVDDPVGHLPFLLRPIPPTDSDAFHAHRSGSGKVVVPVAHHDGNYIADDALLARLDGEARVAFRYTTPDGDAAAEANPNGAVANIAGVLSENRRVLGMMPHPERLNDGELGGTDGARLFESLAGAMAI